MIDALLIQDAWIVACEATCCQDADSIKDPPNNHVICTTCGCDVPIEEWKGRCPVCGTADEKTAVGE